MMFIVGLFALPIALFADPEVSANGQAPTNPCAGEIIANSTTQTSNQLQISGATGSDNSLQIFTGRDGDVVQRESAPLGVQNGTLPPRLCLGTVVSDLVRSDGESIPTDQVTSWAQTGNAGLRVFIYIQVSPRYGTAATAAPRARQPTAAA